jgi:hypothetical protein
MKGYVIKIYGSVMLEEGIFLTHSRAMDVARRVLEDEEITDDDDLYRPDRLVVEMEVHK